MSAAMYQPSDHSTNSPVESEPFKSPELHSTSASVPPSETFETSQAPEAPQAFSPTEQREPEELKRPITLYNSVANLLKQHKCLTASGSIITCRACMNDFKFVSTKGTWNITSHLKTKIHEKNLEKFVQVYRSPVRFDEEDELGPPLSLHVREHNFHTGLLRWLVASGIPLEKVDLAPFKEFADKYFPFRILDSTNYKAQFSNEILKFRTEYRKL